jgi:hypothetical protein
MQGTLERSYWLGFFQLLLAPDIAAVSWLRFWVGTVQQSFRLKVDAKLDLAILGE